MGFGEGTGQGFNPVLKDRIQKPFNKPGLSYLFEIFSGDSSDPAEYFGEDPRRRDDSIESLSETLSSGSLRNHTQQFLDHLDELNDARIAKGRTIDYLEESYGVDDSLVEEVFGEEARVLLILYDQIYQDGVESVDLGSLDREFRNFLYTVQFFTANTETVYYTDEKLPDFEKVIDQSKRFEKQKNRGRQRAFHARTKLVDEDTLKIHFFEELPPRRERIFKFRKPEGSDKSGKPSSLPHHPKMSRTTRHRVKSLGISVQENKDDRTQFVFSKDPRNRWESAVEEFFAEVIGFTDPFDTLSRERSEVAVQIESTARDAATEEKQVREVVRDVQSVIGERAGKVVADLEDEDKEFRGDVEDIRNLLENVELGGIRVVQDQTTATGYFELRAQDTLSSSMESVEGLDDAFLTYLERSEKESVRPILQVRHEDGSSEKIILKDGTWSSLHRSLSDETTEALNYFFEE